MLLKNLMEDRKLNLNQPLLSVRRNTPTVTSQGNAEQRTDLSLAAVPRLPRFKPELKSGPVRNPGAVPFLWEQTPGQPKEEVNPKPRNFDRPPLAPKLPPGRHPKASQRDKQNVYVSPVTNDCKNEEVVNVPPNSRIGPSLDDVENSQSSKVKTEEKESSVSGDSDGEYVDALDRLSRTGSFFINCSMSGLSGLDDSEMKPSGSFSTDPQVRDFMMDRFLPAAKAMTSDTPQYAPKSQPLAREQPQQVMKTVHQVKPSLRYGDSFAKRYSEYPDNDNEEEDSDDDYDRHENFPAVCGLLPRFCLKGSLCLLNPVPAMSVRTRVPISSANRIQPRSPSPASTENEAKSDASETKSMDKILTVDLGEDKTQSRKESCQLESYSKSAFCDPPLYSIEEKEVLSTPKEKLLARIDGSRLSEKGFKAFHELLADITKETESGDHVVEKTLHVDTVQKVESPSIKSFAPDVREDTQVVPGSGEEDHVDVYGAMDKMQAIDSSLEDFKMDIVGGEEKFLQNAHDCGDIDAFSMDNKSNQKWEVKMPKSFDPNHNLYLHSTTAKNTEVAEKDASDSIEKQMSSGAAPKNPHQNYIQLVVPPPLPKSPSDSWLRRTLPFMSIKNYGAANLKAISGDIKWEIVKTTKVQQRHHLRCSEEPLTPIPET